MVGMDAEKITNAVNDCLAILAERPRRMDDIADFIARLQSELGWTASEAEEVCKRVVLAISQQEQSHRLN